jgi:hypothetical protein
MSMLDMLQERLGGDAVRQISQRLGTDPGTTQSAIAAALPMIVGGLAKNAQDPAKAGSLATALQKDHDGSILDNVAGYLGGAQPGGDGAGILGHVFGGHKGAVEQGVSQASGMEPGKTSALLSMLAPLVMGALGKSARERGLDPGGLASMLGGERERAAQQAPGGLMGMLSGLLDKNHDGSVVDDIGGMIGSRFGR